jgi:hypothetical protein
MLTLVHLSRGYQLGFQAANAIDPPILGISPHPLLGSGLFHFFGRDIVLASIHFRDRRKIMLMLIPFAVALACAAVLFWAPRP